MNENDVSYDDKVSIGADNILVPDNRQAIF